MGTGTDGARQAAARLTHLDARGRARMVDVGAKAVTERVAVARATVRMQPATLRLIRSGEIAKGEVLAVARIAGIMAAKRTADLIPLCHPLPIEVAGHRLRAARRGGRLEISATVQGERQDRRRDGGADRGERRRADRLRHVQGGRPRHGHHRRRPAREARRPQRHVEAESDPTGSAARQRELTPRVAKRRSPHRHVRHRSRSSSAPARIDRSASAIPGSSRARSATSIRRCAPGSLVRCCAADGEVLGVGYVNPALHDRGAPAEPAPTSRSTPPSSRAGSRRRIALRARVVGADTDAYRLINGEGDGLPGMLVDRYGGVAGGADASPPAPSGCGRCWSRRCVERLRPRAVVERSEGARAHAPRA